MSKLKFEPSDFSKGINHTLTIGHGIDGKYISLSNALSIAQAKFDAWLESQPVVYSGVNQQYWGREIDDEGRDTHSARLVCIEPIEKPKCEHGPEFITMSRVLNKQDAGWRCIKCGIHLKPTGWEPV